MGGALAVRQLTDTDLAKRRIPLFKDVFRTNLHSSQSNFLYRPSHLSCVGGKASSIHQDGAQGEAGADHSTFTELTVFHMKYCEVRSKPVETVTQLQNCLRVETNLLLS